MTRSAWNILWMGIYAISLFTITVFQTLAPKTATLIIFSKVLYFINYFRVEGSTSLVIPLPSFPCLLPQSDFGNEMLSTFGSETNLWPPNSSVLKIPMLATVERNGGGGGEFGSK